jgi:hypothetical protein
MLLKKRNDCCTIPTIFFFKLTIGSVFLHVSPKYLMIDLKKKIIVRVVQEL